MRFRKKPRRPLLKNIKLIPKTFGKFCPLQNIIVPLQRNNKKKTWLLITYEKENSASNNRTDTDGTINDSKRNDTATPQDTIFGSKGMTNFRTIKANLKETQKICKILMM